MAKVATDFNKIIEAGRERKRNQDLAAKIFSKDNRRSSAPIKAGTGPSLASRVGVKKRGAVARNAKGDISGEWTHDLHSSNSAPNLRPQRQTQAKPNDLAARIHAPGAKAPPQAPTKPANYRANNRTAKLATALSRSSNNPAAAAQMNVQSAPRKNGLIIRGLAGPFVVMIQNLAPGTTAADIESAMTPVGGLVSRCRLVKTHPIVIAEVEFESREGAEQVIQTFNNQTADGRLLYVYLKPPGAYTPTEPRAQRINESRPGGNNVVVDGSMGFDEPVVTSDAGHSDGGLYSDKLVGTNNSNRRGRGFINRGRGGR